MGAALLAQEIYMKAKATGKLLAIKERRLEQAKVYD
jgi:hypothetical protein